jgi:hypothetical protein
MQPDLKTDLRTDEDADLQAAVPDAIRPRRAYLQWLSLAVSFVLLFGCGYFIYHRIDTGEIVGILTSLDIKWFVAAVIIYWLLFPITAYRFRYVFRWCKPESFTTKLRMALILKITLSSGFVAVAAPVGLVADAAKIGAFRVFGKLSTTLAARCTLFDRALAAQWMAILSLASLVPQLMLGVGTKTIGIQLAAAGVVVAGVVALLALPRLMSVFRHPLIVKIAHMFAGYKAMFAPRRLVIQGIFALVSSAISWIVVVCLLKSASLTADLWLLACFMPFLQLINSVPFHFMGWGGREIAVATTLGTAGGLSLNAALAVSAAWGIVLLVTGAINGVFLIGDWRSYHSGSSSKS